MNFTNETLNIDELPKYQEVPLQPLHPDYWKVMLISRIIFFVILGIVTGIVLFFNDEIREFWGYFMVILLVLFGISVVLGKLGFKKKGYAFRKHDVLYKSGIISETTTIIPFSRIQHVAMHEGVFARMFGLASIGIFTAGGGDSDIEIPGIEKEKALQIKQLLMSKLSEEPENPIVDHDGESEL
ncbi:PH domain-containing protein [Flavobacterium suncheonense]|uniref:PH domain-containing protein n=1 Tax=Flavobacterium suncheonense TaxID=350894 RepID=UPI0003FBA0C0|nr:PH domain-containing protein [Flavobacterium suncheonense]